LRKNTPRNPNTQWKAFTFGANSLPKNYDSHNYADRPIAPYSHRKSHRNRRKGLAPLWQAFAAERESIDPSMLVKPNFEFEKYVIN
jgi:hypothetical protein